MIETILVAVDLEDTSLTERMLAVTSDFAKLKGGQVTLAYVATDVPPAAAMASPLDTANPRFWSVACHLSGLIPLVVGLPFLGPIAPLILWRTKRDEFAAADFHGREELNFQLNILLWTVVPAITSIGAPITLIALAANVVLSIVAAVSASNGDAYRYPGIYRAVNEGEEERATGRVV